ncbi:hypothetical protein ABN028_34680 [Actinopolymorpha sp. B17G11]|uniref:hypothetical protein n=1 Tax=Actinopolymorpha sp. B17G11 TaxID=3160861 RepID=UPI0032E4017C
MKLPSSCVNQALSTQDVPVWLIETVECCAGSAFQLVFESAEPRWHQGVWLGVEGQLEVAGQTSPQAVLWRDTAPPSVEIVVRSSEDGLLRLYNVWDSGRGYGRESQAATSGMLRETTTDGLRYRCSDIRPSPTFEALVFRLDRLEQTPK